MRFLSKTDSTALACIDCAFEVIFNESISIPPCMYSITVSISTVLVTSKLLNIVTYLAIQQCRTRSNSRRVNVQVELQQQLINLLRTAIQISTFVGILLGLGVTTALQKPIFKNEGEPISKYWPVFVAKLFGVLAWKGEKSPNDPITKCTYQFDLSHQTLFALIGGWGLGYNQPFSSS